MTYNNNEASSLTLKISRYSISCFFYKNIEARECAVISSLFETSESIAQNIENLTESLHKAILEAEKISERRFEKVILLLDLGAFDKRNIKFKLTGELDFTVIRRKIEEKMQNKIIGIWYNGIVEDYKLFEVLSLSKTDMQIIFNIISSIGLEILEWLPDFKYMMHKAYNVCKQEKFIFLKFTNQFLEYATVKRGIIANYNINKEYSFEAIFSTLSAMFEVPKNVIVKLLKYYNTTSKVERLKIYYEREKEDLEIFEFIENTNLILNIQNSIKKLMEKMIFEIGVGSDVTTIAFYYAGENIFFDLENLKLHNFISYKIETIEVSLNLESKQDASTSEEKVPIMGIFAKQMKKIFHLSS